MTHQMRIPIGLAFVVPDTPAFSDLIDRLKEEETLKEGRRRDLISGLRRVAKAIGLPPDDIPSDSRWLQPRLGTRRAARDR